MSNKTVQITFHWPEDSFLQLSAISAELDLKFQAYVISKMKEILNTASNSKKV